MKANMDFEIVYTVYVYDAWDQLWHKSIGWKTEAEAIEYAKKKVQQWYNNNMTGRCRADIVKTLIMES